MRGALALIGGDEFKPGNEEQDRFLEAQRGPGPAYVLVTANGKHPDLALETACNWFARCGLLVEELPVRSRAEALSPKLAQRARGGGFFYLAGGDPRRVVEVLRHSPVWAAIRQAWKEGAALAGSSAGAMALGRWTLLGAEPPLDALEVVREAAVLPHYASFGKSWETAARTSLGPSAWLLGLDERTALVHHESPPGRPQVVGGGASPAGWRVLGPGQVHVLQGDRRAAFTRGEPINLRLSLQD